MTTHRYFLWAFCAIGSIVPLAAGGDATQPNAAQQLERLQQEAQAAHAANNTQARLEAALKIQKLLNDSPQAVEDAARVYAEAGDPQHALEAIGEFANLGQSDDRLFDGGNKNFTALDKLLQDQTTQSESIVKRLAENKTPVSHADLVFTIPDAELLPEDIDYDPQSKTFLITGILEKKIIRIDPKGKATDFASSPSHWPMMAIKIDAARKLVWATEVAIDGFHTTPQSDWGHSALLCFDLGSGALRSRIEGPPHSALGDMVLSRDGMPVISDGDGGGVYILRGNKLERIDSGDFISPQTAAAHPDGRHLFIPDYLRGIGIFDEASGKTIWLAPQGKYALNGIDGLYFDRGALLATQNGTSPERVIRFSLNSTLDGIVSEQMIERATSTLGDPTHGVVVGDSFYYIANSGWDTLDDHGAMKAGAKMTQARMMRFVLMRRFHPSE
jgi:sugar lactone lactonase YvrE